MTEILSRSWQTTLNGPLFFWHEYKRMEHWHSVASMERPYHWLHSLLATHRHMLVGVHGLLLVLADVVSGLWGMLGWILLGLLSPLLIERSW